MGWLTKRKPKALGGALELHCRYEQCASVGEEWADAEAWSHQWRCLLTGIMRRANDAGAGESVADIQRQAFHIMRKAVLQSEANAEAEGGKEPQ